jgi:hypothetical protein
MTCDSRGTRNTSKEIPPSLQALHFDTLFPSPRTPIFPSQPGIIPTSTTRYQGLHETHPTCKKEMEYSLANSSVRPIQLTNRAQSEGNPRKLSHSVEEQTASVNTVNRHRRALIAPFEEWYNLHRDDPYPSLAVKVELASAAGKSVEQVSNWFNNKRCREKTCS